MTCEQKTETYKRQFEIQRMKKYIAEGNNLYQATWMSLEDSWIIAAVSDTPDDDLIFKDELETNEGVLKTHHNAFMESMITHLTTKPYPTYKVVL
jgi:hypothetical protein